MDCVRNQYWIIPLGSFVKNYRYVGFQIFLYTLLYHLSISENFMTVMYENHDSQFYFTRIILQLTRFEWCFDTITHADEFPHKCW